MKPEQLHILQHSLGCDQYGSGSMYRNRFVTGPGSTDFDDCRALVAAGYMHDEGSQKGFGGDHLFWVTDAGKAAMREASPPAPKLNRNKRRYQAFLDADCGLRFGEWLKAKRYQYAGC